MKLREAVCRKRCLNSSESLTARRRTSSSWSELKQVAEHLQLHPPRYGQHEGVVHHRHGDVAAQTRRHLEGVRPRQRVVHPPTEGEVEDDVAVVVACPGSLRCNSIPIVRDHARRRLLLHEIGQDGAGRPGIDVEVLGRANAMFSSSGSSSRAAISRRNRAISMD